MPWLLGSSDQSAIWAGELGLRYAFADFINPHGADIARPTASASRPCATSRRRGPPSAAWALCAPTDEEAQFLASSSRMTFTLLRRGQLIAGAAAGEGGGVPGARGAAHAVRRTRAAGAIVGSPETVRAGIEAVAAAYQADEVIVVTITYDHGVRRRSYELLAEALDLEPRGRGGADRLSQSTRASRSRVGSRRDEVGLRLRRGLQGHARAPGRQGGERRGDDPGARR